ncbi:aminoacyl-histidine dipeptidase [Calditrichota bacterium]
MKSVIEGLKPAKVWEHFYQVSQIPRGSGNEEAMGEYVISVAKKNNLQYKKDSLGNVVVMQPATPGFENRPTVIIQGHTDMVCEKNNDTIHDFEKDPIKLVRNGDWIKADGTTLGADNGIGFCCGLAIMDDDSIEHPAMEYLFTVDEETGLTGAAGLSQDFVKGRIMLNLDSEEEGALYIGCAGGKHTILRRKIELENTPTGLKAMKIKIGGLSGGHSGLNIDQGLGNSIKLISRLLYNLKSKMEYRLANINAGNKHNAIPREAESTILISANDEKTLNEFAQKMDEIYKFELKFIDKSVFVKIESADPVEKVLSKNLEGDLIRLLYSIPHGVQAMSHAIKGLVETSTNMAIVETNADHIKLLTSQRSSVATSITDIADKVKAIGELSGFEVEQGGGYPAWQPNPDSPLLKLAIETYKEKTGKEPEVKAIHAGLECGLIGEKYPGIDMLSFGPTIEGAHSPDERVKIEDVEKIWDFLLELLKKV